MSAYKILHLCTILFTFQKYFYKYKEPRKTQEIMKEILELDRKLDGVLKELQEDE